MNRFSSDTANRSRGSATHVRSSFVFLAVASVLVVLCVGLQRPMQAAPALPDKSGVGTSSEKKRPARKPLPDRFSSELREVHIGGYQFKFPANHIRYVYPDGRAGTLFARWPGFQGYYKNMGSQRFDAIDTIIDADRGQVEGWPFDTAELDRRFQERVKQGRFPGLVERPALGLGEYKSHRVPESDTRYYRALDPKLVSPDGGRIAFACQHGEFKKGDKGTIRCSAAYWARPDIQVTIRFYKRHLHDWRAIHESVFNLVQSAFSE